MSLKLPNDNSCCAFRPPMPPLGSARDENKLERFLDKIDANDDGEFSRKELSEAADNNNDGHVSQKEKDAMRDQLNGYIKEAAKDGTWNMKSLGQAQEVMEFLEEKTNPTVVVINGKTYGLGEVDPPTGGPQKRTHGLGEVDPPTGQLTDIHGKTHGMGAILDDHKPGRLTDIHGKTHGMGAILDDRQPRNPYIEPHKSKYIDEIGFDPDSPSEFSIQPVPLPVDKQGKELPLKDILTPDWQKMGEKGTPKK